jgi:hypothetical protein
METKYGSACKAVPGYDVKIQTPLPNSWRSKIQDEDSKKTNYS